MTMIADSCCRSGAGLTIQDLLDRMLPAIAPVTGVETVTLRAARGRVLAENLVAERPVPDFARSAVDGYALRARDLGQACPDPREGAAADMILPLRGRVAAGDGTDGLAVGPGAVRIFTGAPLPPDCDRVVMQEDCRELPGAVHVRRIPRSGDNVRPSGDDLAAGQVAIAAGTLLDARHLGVGASLGRTSLPVRRRLRVAVLSTGSELVPPGEDLRPGCIHASNGYVIGGLLEAAGFEVVDLGVVVDDPDLIDAALRSAGGTDALVTSGGVSVGDEDHVRGAVGRVGGRIDHWRLAIKPGKPIAIGSLPGGSGRDLLFVGLPGNPNAVFVTLSLIGLPLLRALAGLPQRRQDRLTVRADHGWRRSPGRTEYVSARLLPAGPDGIAAVERMGGGGSAQQCALGRSDALLIVPAEVTEIREGDLLQALSIDSLI